MRKINLIDIAKLHVGDIAEVTMEDGSVRTVRAEEAPTSDATDIEDYCSLCAFKDFNNCLIPCAHWEREDNENFYFPEFPEIFKSNEE